MRLLTKYLSLSALIFIISTHACAQIAGLYLDAGAKMGFFHTRTPQQMNHGLLTPVSRIGLKLENFGEEAKSPYYLSLEGSVYVLRYRKEYSDVTFEYRFWSADAGAVLTRQMGERFAADVGVMACIFVPSLAEKPGRAKLGGNFSGFDIRPLIGAQYQLGKYFTAGSRLYWGTLPMVYHQEIGNYGEVKPKKGDIFSRTIELYIRFTFG